MFESLNRKMEAAARRAEQERAAARPAHDSTMSTDAFRRGNQVLPDGSKVPTGSVVHHTAQPAASQAQPEAPAQPGEALGKDASNGNGKNRIGEQLAALDDHQFSELLGLLGCFPSTEQIDAALAQVSRVAFVE